MDGFALVPSLAWRNLWRHRGRTFLTILAVTIAVAFMILLGSLLAAWSKSAFDRTTAALTGHGQIHAAGFTDDPAVERSMPAPRGPLAAALAQGAVKAWAPRVVAPALIRSERESAPITLYGVDPEREAAVSFLNPREVDGAALAGGDAQGLVIGRRLADRLQVAPGRRVVIAAQDVHGDIKEIGITVIGLYRGQPDLQMFAVFASISQTQKFLGLGDRISEIAFLATDRSAIGSLTDSLAKAAPDLDVKRWDQLQPFSSAVIEMTNNTNTIWVFVSFALVAFGLINTIMMVVYERMREFGLMQALGMKPHLLIAQVLLESTYLVLFGTLFGAALGIGAILALSGGLDLGSLGVGASMFGASERLYLQVDVGQILWACGAVVGLSIVASVYPVVRATRRVPISILTRAQT